MLTWNPPPQKKKKPALQAFAAVICDSGPLANTAHHPAWGRISETYGEDPYLISQTGVAVTTTMQAPQNGTIKNALTTRHFIGYHKTNTMPDPTMTITDRDLYDAYLPGYQAFQDAADAEGRTPPPQKERLPPETYDDNSFPFFPFLFFFLSTSSLFLEGGGGCKYVDTRPPVYYVMLTCLHNHYNTLSATFFLSFEKGLCVLLDRLTEYRPAPTNACFRTLYEENGGQALSFSRTAATL